MEHYNIITIVTSGDRHKLHIVGYGGILVRVDLPRAILTNSYLAFEIKILGCARYSDTKSGHISTIIDFKAFRTFDSIINPLRVESNIFSIITVYFGYCILLCESRICKPTSEDNEGFINSRYTDRYNFSISIRGGIGYAVNSTI